MAEYTSAESPHSDPELSRRNEGIEGSITRSDLEEEKDSTASQADGDGATVESVLPDGRLSGITPSANSSDVNPSAAEADMQRTERDES